MKKMTFDYERTNAPELITYVMNNGIHVELHPIAYMPSIVTVITVGTDKELTKLRRKFAIDVYNLVVMNKAEADLLKLLYERP